MHKHSQQKGGGQPYLISHSSCFFKSRKATLQSGDMRPYKANTGRGSDVLGKVREEMYWEGEGRGMLGRGGERCAGKGRGEVCWKGEGRGMLERRGEICAGKGREEMCWKGKGRDGLERGGERCAGGEICWGRGKGRGVLVGADVLTG